MRNKEGRMQTATLFVTLAMTIFIGIQTIIIKTQTNILKDVFALEKRPYLYVDIEPLVKGYDETGHFYAGAIITYRNEGLLTASNIKTEAKVASSYGSSLLDITDWYETTYGSYPYVTSVFPKQKIRPVRFTPNLPDFQENNEQYIYFGARIEYTGFTDKVYSYGVNYVYRVEKQVINEKSVINYLVTEVKRDTFWDMNKELPLSSISMPDWSMYKEINKKNNGVEIDPTDNK